MFCSRPINQGSILVLFAISSGERVFESSISAIANTRLSVGFLKISSASSRDIFLPPCSVGSNPLMAGSTIRRAFCILSSQVRPTAMTSPTLFIAVPITFDTPSNLPKSQRGTLVTQ